MNPGTPETEFRHRQPGDRPGQGRRQHDGEGIQRLQAGCFRTGARRASTGSSADFDFIVIEGAGSIAEINLKAHDIANLQVSRRWRTARASWWPTSTGAGSSPRSSARIELLEPSEQARIKGIVINKFRGDPIAADAWNRVCRTANRHSGAGGCSVFPAFPDTGRGQRGAG